MGIKTGLLDGVLGQYVEIKESLPDSDSIWASTRTEKLICKLCGFIVRRGDIRNPKGKFGLNKYWGMKSKMVSHFHRDHPDIWATLERG